MDNIESNEIEIVNVNMFEIDKEFGNDNYDDNNLSIITRDPFEDIGDVSAVPVENEHNGIKGLVEVYIKGENEEMDCPDEQRKGRHRFTIDLGKIENEMDYPDILCDDDLQSYEIRLNPDTDHQNLSSNKQKNRRPSRRKKKTSLSFRSTEAKRKRLVRRMETDRLALQRVRSTISRTYENNAQREERLRTQRQRRALSRSRESAEVRQHRLHADRVRHAISRILESDELRERRLYADRERHAKSRRLESYESRQQRLYADRTRHAKSREDISDGARRRSLRVERITSILSRLIKTEKECAIECLEQNCDCC